MQTMQAQLLAVASAAWGCSELDALRTMQELSGAMPRQLVFDGDFWPTLHVVLQTRMCMAAAEVGDAASAVPMSSSGPGLFELVVEALATLATHELGMMRADFVRFPADAEHANARRISVGPHAHLRWRFQGVHQEAPMHAIAGARIVVTDIVLSEGA
jgi:hypothetical protein